MCWSPSVVCLLPMGVRGYGPVDGYGKQNISFSYKMSCGGRSSAKGCKDFPVVLFIAVPLTHGIEAVRFWNTTEILGRQKPWHIHLLKCQWVSWLSSWEIPLLLCYRNGGCLLQLSRWLHKGTISIVTDIIFLTLWTFLSQSRVLDLILKTGANWK